MVSWAHDGYLSGVARRDNSDQTGQEEGAVYDSQAGHFASPGTVDAEVVTRWQYEIPEGPPVVNGKFTFVSGDWDDLPLLRALTATIFIAPDRLFNEGEVPTPQQIYDQSGDDTDSGVAVVRKEEGPFGEPWGRTTPGDLDFTLEIPSEILEPNTKYWVLLAPTSVSSISPGEPSVDNDIPLAPVNTKGRALSFWTNRTPGAPIITAPLSGTIVPAGSEITFAFLPNDPDGIPTTVTPVTTIPRDVRSWSFSDMSGVQVQYAPRPTVAVPDPTWIDLPITTRDGDAIPGPGYYIEGVPAAPHDGAKGLRDTRTMTLLCDTLDMQPGSGVLPAGNWQLRMRTFDYGHPASTVIIPPTPFTDEIDTFGPGYYPLGHETADLDLETFPEINTSPWSEPVDLGISAQIPAPSLISPINYLAVVEGQSLTLRWLYRNTHENSFDQLQRQVQIRKFGEEDWTTLVSGNSPDAFYSIDDPEPNTADPTPYPEPDEYIADPGFEIASLGAHDPDGWSSQLTSDDTTVIDGPDVRTGAHSLESGTAGTFTTNSVVRTFTLDPDHQFFSFSGWAYEGPNVKEHYALLAFANADVTATYGTFYKFEPEEGDPGWTYWEFEDLERPTGAEKVVVQFVFYSPIQDFSGCLIDDVSFLGNTVSPVKPPTLAPLVLPEQDPIAYSLEATTRYEWRVRVTDEGHATSDWSEVGRFWVVPVPDSGPVYAPEGTIEGATLGVGKHRVFVYRRGGKIRVGELTNLSYVDWGRLRDDMSTAKVIIEDWSVDCGELLARLQSWAYELVIYRDNGFTTDRVWEGPITLPAWEKDKVIVHAKDVMAYPYRRIIKQAMNDFGTSPTAGDPVTSRAARVLQNVLAPDDPNLLQYLTIIEHDDDAKQYRSLPPYSRTAFEEIDDMASNSGLDYTAVGRRIILWSTKHRIGTLPEFRDENLGSSPIVSEYGMSMANRYAVSDGNGVYGEAVRPVPGSDETGEEIDPIYGEVEMLSSSWASDSDPEAGTYTEAGLETIRASFRKYAERSIDDRYPPPVVVRIPDNTTVNPNTVISIQQLVPGVVLPLRSTGTLRVVESNQKLDSVKVVETAGKETVSITLSPFNRDDVELEEE